MRYKILLLLAIFANLSAVCSISSHPLIIVLESLYGDDWGGVVLKIEAVGFTTTSYAPSVGSNPRLLTLDPTAGTFYLITATYPNNIPSDSNEAGLKCKVYWNASIRGTSESYQGTYLSSIGLLYDATSDSWSLQLSGELITEKPVCVPSVSPTWTPTAGPSTAMATQVTIGAEVSIAGVDCDNDRFVTSFNQAIIFSLDTDAINAGVTSCNTVVQVQQRPAAYVAFRRLTEDIRLAFEVSFILEEMKELTAQEAFTNVSLALQRVFDDGSVANHLNASGELPLEVNASFYDLVVTGYTVEVLRTPFPTFRPTRMPMQISSNSGSVVWYKSWLIYMVYGFGGGIILLLCACIIPCCRRHVCSCRSDDDDSNKTARPREYIYTKSASKHHSQSSEASNGSARPLSDQHLVIKLIEEHSRLNVSLRKLLRMQTPKEPALLRFIITSFDPLLLSREHKRYLKEFLDKLATDNKQLWTRAVKEGLKKNNDTPLLLIETINAAALHKVSVPSSSVIGGVAAASAFPMPLVSRSDIISGNQPRRRQLVVDNITGSSVSPGTSENCLEESPSYSDRNTESELEFSVNSSVLEDDREDSVTEDSLMFAMIKREHELSKLKAKKLSATLLATPVDHHRDVPPNDVLQGRQLRARSVSESEATKKALSPAPMPTAMIDSFAHKESMIASSRPRRSRAVAMSSEIASALAQSASASDNGEQKPRPKSLQMSPVSMRRHMPESYRRVGANTSPDSTTSRSNFIRDFLSGESYSTQKHGRSNMLHQGASNVNKTKSVSLAAAKGSGSTLGTITHSLSGSGALSGILELECEDNATISSCHSEIHSSPTPSIRL